MEENEKNNEHLAWLYDQIGKYQGLQESFEKYAVVLGQILREAAKERAPLAIIETRAKKICSFAEKSQRKRDSLRDPVNQFTDLCGGRVITHTYAEVESICRFIENHFEIDAVNSVKISQRLKPSEFGYRSVHYIVQLNPAKLAQSEIKVEIPPELVPSPENPCPMKAEIQVRTLLEHAWAAFSHERVYKGLSRLPLYWERELAGLAAILEEADKAFMRIQTGLQSLTSSYGSYMTQEQILAEIEIQKRVRDCESDDPKLAHKIALLAIAGGAWKEAIEALQPFEARYRANPDAHSVSAYQPIIRDLGLAYCKGSQVGSKEFKLGQYLMKEASQMNPADPDAPASLAGSYKKMGDEASALEYYKEAYRRDSSDPYAVSNFLVYEIRQRKDLTPVPFMEPSIRSAMQRCREQIAVGVNVFWSYYNLGIFHLLLNEPYESLIAYTRAVRLSLGDWMVDTSLNTLELLEPVNKQLEGYQWMRKILHLGRAINFTPGKPSDHIRDLATDLQHPIQAPVIILSGGTDSKIEKHMQAYRRLVLEAFQDFHGTIISGGTRAGIAGMAGDLQETYPENVSSIGYIPSSIPYNIELDKRYQTHRNTTGKDFSALETIQYWIDIVTSGIHPESVKLLGINGGRIAAAEYRLALALGAKVGIIAGSGRSADELLADPEWKDSPNLLRLENDPPQVHAFVCPGSLPVAQSDLLQLACNIHNEYRRRRVDTLHEDDPAMKEWDSLRSDYQISNLDQANHIPAKLRKIGCRIVKLESGEIKEYLFSKDEIEIMAEMEHNRWWVDRSMAGWKYGKERDPEKKTSPYLIAWSKLPEETKNWTRSVVSRIPGLLKELGYEIQKIR